MASCALIQRLPADRFQLDDQDPSGVATGPGTRGSNTSTFAPPGSPSTPSDDLGHPVGQSDEGCHLWEPGSSTRMTTSLNSSRCDEPARSRCASLTVVTGAFGYTGRYITGRLLESGRAVKTLTGHPHARTRSAIGSASPRSTSRTHGSSRSICAGRRRCTTRTGCGSHAGT